MTSDTNWHLYDFSPVWHLTCVLRWSPWANVLWHNSHLYGLSPVWVLRCSLRLLLSANDSFYQVYHVQAEILTAFMIKHTYLWHNWHVYGFSPVWVFICVFRLRAWANDLWHNWHAPGLSPVWVLMFALSWSPQLLQANNFRPSWHIYDTSFHTLSFQITTFSQLGPTADTTEKLRIVW